MQLGKLLFIASITWSVNTLSGQNSELFNCKAGVHIVTTVSLIMCKQQNWKAVWAVCSDVLAYGRV